VIAYAGMEQYVDGLGNPCERFRLPVQNWTAYDPALFASTPDFGSCGLNASPSRAWVDVRDAATNNPIYGFCALDSPASLTELWFATCNGAKQAGSVYVTITDRGCNTTWTSAPVAVNTPPRAEAGPDQSVVTLGTSVTLVGSAIDDEGDALSYAWSFLAHPGPSAPTLSGATSATPSFVAAEHGDYVLQLTVAEGVAGDPGYSPPTPPDVRVRIRRFESLRSLLTRAGVFALLTRAP